MTNAPQEMIGKYRVIASLASGSQGTVYRAHDPTLGRDVALKVLHPHLATPEVIARFRREAQIVASISHPNIAGISEIGEHNGSHFIAIEYVPHAASELIGRGAMDVVHAASIAHQTALALEAARASRHGITHHDVKPDNLLLTSLDAGGAVKLIDFGIAHAAGMASMTQAGSQWGTPFYMPPEQWAGERGDTRSDVYSLGVVMYQMLAGRAPFDSDAEIADVRQTEIARQHREAVAPPLRSIRADVSEELEAVVAKCMAKSPSERFQTPGELAAELAGMFSLAAPDASLAASRPPVEVSPEPRRPSSPRAPRPSGQTPPIFDKLPPNLRHRAPLLAAGIAGALIVIVTLIIMASQSGDDQPPLPPRIMVVSPPTHTPTPPPPDNPNALADLTVVSIDWEPEKPELGRDVTFTATVRNMGDGRAAASALRLHVVGESAGLAPLPSIPPGGTASADFVWTAKTGTHTLIAVVDPNLTVRETNDDNNSMGKAYGATALPDLVVVSIEWAPEKPELGQNVTFTATVRNAGDGRAAATSVRLHVGESVGSTLLPSIQSGGTASADFGWTALDGTHTLTAVVDETRTVSETNDDNNSLSKSYDATLMAAKQGKP